MDLLLQLVTQPGIVLSKDALLHAVWPGRIVEENNLTVHMTALRRALARDGGGPGYIRTVVGRGYMFVADHAIPDPTPSVPPQAAGRRSLPPPPALVGRRQAQDALRDLIRQRRLVTIVGPGGVGKTSLALTVAADAASNFADGAVLVDLAPVTDPAIVPDIVAAALQQDAGSGSRNAIDRLIALLGRQHALLVIDNCEHLISAVAALLEHVLRDCPLVSILCTSREGLFLQNEHLYRLPPLTFPEHAEGLSPDGAAEFGAIQLFVERARAFGAFALTETTAPLVATICARLDGIPLAIEMAVPRLRVLPLAELAERLNERLQLLGSPGRQAPTRHRTLNAVFDWSYDLLQPAEQALLCGLSVFAGGADLAAIGQVVPIAGHDEWEVLDLLAGLVDKSLVVADTSASARFRMLETVREYATRKRIETGDLELNRRHAAYYAEHFATAARDWHTTSGQEWQANQAADVENLRAALNWSFGSDGDDGIGLKLAAASVPFWWELPSTPLAEGQRWLQVADEHGADAPRGQLGWVMFGRTWRDFRFGDVENLAAALEAAAIFRETGDVPGLGAALWRAGSAALTPETYRQAEECLTEAEAVLRGTQAGKWLALTLIRLGDLRMREDRLALALQAYQEGFAISRKLDFWIGLVNGGSNMAELLFTQGQRDQALDQLQGLKEILPAGRRTPLMATLSAHLLIAGDEATMMSVAREAITQASALGLPAALAWTVEAVALLAATRGDAETGAILAGHSRAVHPFVATRAGARREVVHRLYALLDLKLPKAKQQGLMENGASLAEAAIVRLALEQLDR